MGMYDIIRAPCPKCSTPIELQSKSGACLLQEFTLDDAPPEVLAGVNALAPYRCGRCGSYVRIEEENGVAFPVQVGRPVAEYLGKIPYRRRRPPSP